jgi:hypothetical protein
MQRPSGGNRSGRRDSDPPAGMRWRVARAASARAAEQAATSTSLRRCADAMIAILACGD